MFVWMQGSIGRRGGSSRGGFFEEDGNGSENWMGVLVPEDVRSVLQFSGPFRLAAVAASVVGRHVEDGVESVGGCFCCFGYWIC